MQAKNSSEPSFAPKDQGIAKTSENNLFTDKLANCDQFVHEPEELCALYHSKFCFPISLSIFNTEKITSSPTEFNDHQFADVNDKMSQNHIHSLQSVTDLESDLAKNKKSTDADILKEVCVFSERTASPVPNDAYGKAKMRM